jgi:hypothetical protein
VVTHPNALNTVFRQPRGKDSIRYNLMDAGVQQRDGATGTVSNNVTNAQPSWFVNAASGDLHLAAIAATAIDKAAVHPSVLTDYDAETRPQDTVPDIGADEFSLGSQPPEAPTNVRVLVIVSGVSASLHHLHAAGYLIVWRERSRELPRDHGHEPSMELT